MELYRERLITNPDQLIWTRQVCHRIWQNYARAMARRRKKSILPKDRFINYVCQDFVVYKYRCRSLRSIPTVIFGQERYGIFCPSHFCPNTMREGYRLIKDLRQEKVLFAVTEDLSPMLRKAGYIVLPFKIPMMFRGQTVWKKVAISRWEVLKPAIQILLDEFKEKSPVYRRAYKIYYNLKWLWIDLKWWLDGHISKAARYMSKVISRWQKKEVDV